MSKLPANPAPQIPTFAFQSHQVRTIMEDGQLWFVAKDVCAALEIGWAGRVLNSIPDSWQRMCNLHIRRGTYDVRVISEPAVYKLAFRSNKPEADAFTNWVASEVIPAIRKTGKFAVDEKPRRERQKALPKPSAPAFPRFTPRTTMDEIEARLTTLCLHVQKERFSIYVDLLNQFCNTYTPRIVPADVVCSSVSNAIYSLINDCLLRAGDNPLQFDNPCKLVREVRDMLESVRA